MPDLYQMTLQHKAIVAHLREMYPEETDDTLADTIEGLSDIKEAIIATLRAALEAEALAEGLAALLTGMQERKVRWEARSKRLRLIALQAAQETGNTKLVAADFSASVSSGKPAVIIPDPAAVPETFQRIKREPDRRAIGDALAAGLCPSWASWSNATPYWVIRTK